MVAVVIILLLILIAVLAAAAFDFLPFLRDMLGRRGIGSLSFDGEWYERAEALAENWLENGVPVVPQNAEKKYAFVDSVKGVRRNDSIQHWQEASVLLAVNEVNPEIGAEFIREKITEQEAFDNNRVDIAMLSYAMMKNGSVDGDRIKPFPDKTAEILLKKYNRTAKIPYSRNDNVCYVDTIGLVCPFLVKYAFDYNEPKALEAAVKIIKDYSRDGIHAQLGLPVHCYDDSNGAPLGIYGWGRGSGWWAVGLADTFRELNEREGYVEEKTAILKLILKFADAVLEYQHDNGAFDRNLLYFSGEDSSATAMIAYFLAYAGRLTKRDRYTQAAENALKYVCSVTRKDGTVDYSQGDTMGVGFYSTASIVVPAAQGFALRAYRLIKGEDN